jgi:Fe-S cluster assembly protein SufD
MTDRTIERDLKMSKIAIERDLTDEIVSVFPNEAFSFGLDNRKQALSHFEKLGLPTSKSEEYRFTPITKSLAKIIDWSTANTPSTLMDIAPFLIQQIDASVLVFVNGLYSEKLSRVIHSETEITISSLASAFKTHPELTNRCFGKVLSSKADPFAALNTAFWQSGLFIHVSENKQVAKPILLLHINDANHNQVIATTRLLAVVEKNSSLSIIEKFDSVGQQSVFHTFCEEIIVQEGAQFAYCKVQNDYGSSTQVTNTVIHQSDKSKVNTFTLTLNGELVRNNFSIIIDGENCESHFHGLYLLDGGTVADNHTVVDHRKPNSFSNELYKGIMDGNSKGVFNGKIFVRPHAQKTNAFQSNRNILMTDSATINTKPQLEIWADDVKCSHGCTSGQLDEEALFYLQTRGIPHDSAKAMLLYAFALDVLATVKDEGLKTYLDDLISVRLNKNF